MTLHVKTANPEEESGDRGTTPRGSIDDQSDSSISEFARRGIRITGMLTVLIGAFWLVAWTVGIVPSWSATGMMTPKTNISLAQLMGGVALLLLGFGTAGGLRRWAGVTLAALVTLLGALTLSEHLFGWNLGVDQLLATESPGALATLSPNRIGPSGCISLTFLGLGLLTLAMRKRAITAYLGIATIVINLVPAVGFLYGIDPFYVAPHLTGIAWPTVIALMSLGMGLLFSSSDRAPVSLLLRDDPGGRLLRRLLPTVLLITLVLGFVAVQIARRGIYEVETVTGLLVIAMILVFSVMLWRGANKLSRSSSARLESEDRLRLAQAAARIGAFEWNIRTDVNIWSPELEAIYGLTPGAFARTQQAWADLVHPEDRAEAVHLVEHSFETGEPTEGEWRVVWPDRSVHWIFGRWQVFKGQSGEPLRMTGVNIDITERERAENTVQASVRILTAANTPARSVDETIQVVLDEIESLTGSTISFYHFLDADQETLTLQMWSSNTMRTMCTAEGKGSHYPISKAGVWVDCVRERRPVIHNDYQSLPNRKGLPEGHAPVIRELVVPVIRGDRIVAIIGVGNKPTDYIDADVEIVSCLGDLSWVVVERKRAEEALRESQEDLNRAQAVAHTGSWRMDVRRDVLEWSEENHRIFGIPQGTPMTYEAFLASVHPDDREYVDREWMAALQGEHYDIEHRIVIGDTVRWVRERAELEFDRNGELIGGFGTTEDITERKRTEQALHEAEESKIEFYRRMVMAATDGKLVIAERAEIERITGAPVASWEIHDADDTKTVRHGVEQTARSLGMTEPQLGQLAVAVGEATTNAVKHAGGGRASLHCPDSRLVLVVSDSGPGIPALTLPDVALKRGYSTAGTLGMGYKLMIQFADRIHLATDEEGTTVAIEVKLGDGDTR